MSYLHKTKEPLGNVVLLLDAKLVNGVQPIRDEAFILEFILGRFLL